MRFEFTQTGDDFREASEASIVAASKTHGPLAIIALLWQLGGLGIVAVLLMKFDPSVAMSGRTHFFLSFAVIPMVPWVMILGYLFWFTSQTVRLGVRLNKR